MAASHLTESEKVIGDIVSVGTVLGTLSGLLPAIAATITIIWTSIRIYETDTVQKILGKQKIEKKDE
jgi:hypothetical protein